MKKFLSPIVILSLLIGVLLTAPIIHAGPLVSDWSVKVCEDTNLNGDCWDHVDISSNQHIANLTCCTNNLHNGCNALLQSSNWNDCISSVRISGMPSGKIGLYGNANYNTRLFCYGNGTFNTDGFYNDQISSWRWESC